MRLCGCAVTSLVRAAGSASPLASAGDDGKVVLSALQKSGGYLTCASYLHLSCLREGSLSGVLSCQYKLTSEHDLHRCKVRKNKAHAARPSHR